MAIADERIHGTTHEAPIVRLDREECMALRPLPLRAVGRREQRLLRHIPHDALVGIDTVRYSPPPCGAAFDADPASTRTQDTGATGALTAAMVRVDSVGASAAKDVSASSNGGMDCGVVGTGVPMVLLAGFDSASSPIT
jgi:hypothetical protein